MWSRLGREDGAPTALGPARTRPHRTLAAALARERRWCGAEVVLDRTVIEVAKQDRDGSIEEAILDHVVGFPGAVQQLFA